MSSYACVPAMHGRRHLEFEITYPLDMEAAGDEHYRLDAWFHIPHPLPRWGAADPREIFFNNLISHTRFRPFDLPLHTLSDLHDERNPLTRIHAIAKSGRLHQGQTLRKMIYEMRMLVNVFQAQFRGQSALIEQMVAGGQYPPADIATVINRLLREADDILRIFHEMESDMLAPHVPEDARRNYRWADESLSIRAEKNFFRIYRTLTGAGMLPHVAGLCRDKIAHQIDHRRAHHYETLTDPDDDRANELFSYREHQLKKWAESAMYMTVAFSRAPDRMLHLLFSLAAAGAMAFALLVALLADRYFHMHSYPWVVLAIVAYVFKDRTKDLLRGIALRWMPRLISDRIRNIINPYSGNRVGVSRERLRRLPAEEAPEPVRRIRHIRSHAYQTLNPPEDVLHYHKHVQFRAAALRATEARLSALAEIIRLDMRPWFDRMDKSDDRMVHITDNRLRTVKARRVYHINVILQLTGGRQPAGPATLCRFRVVASRAGIVRIEEVR